MPSAALKMKHTYVTTEKGVCYRGGRLLWGLGFPFGPFRAGIRKGSSVEQIQHNVYPSLGLAEIYDALSDYHDHREEIDHQVEENSLSSREVKKRQARWQQSHSS